VFKRKRKKELKMTSDRILLKTVLRAWVTQGYLSGTHPNEFSDQMSVAILGQATSAEVVEDLRTAINEVADEMMAEFVGTAAPVTARPFETETSTARHPNVD
jgi:hypothetical protein